MKIRSYAKSVGFDVIGNLRLMGKWNLCCRWYMDEGGNAYVVDVILGTIRIIPNKKG